MEDEIFLDIEALFSKAINGSQIISQFENTANILEAEKTIFDRIGGLRSRSLLPSDPREANVMVSRNHLKTLSEKIEIDRLEKLTMQRKVAKLENKLKVLRLELEKKELETGSTLVKSEASRWKEKTMPELKELLQELVDEMKESPRIPLAEKYRKVGAHLNSHNTGTEKYYKTLAVLCGMKQLRKRRGSHEMYDFKLENSHTLKGTEFTFCAHSACSEMSPAAIKDLLISLLQIIEYEKEQAHML